MRQRTIREAAVIHGTGLQTGNKVAVTFRPAREGAGITFVRTDLPGRPRIGLGSLPLGEGGAPERRTTIGIGPLQVQTIEHLLAALCALSITNIDIELDNVELPGLDGSARDFLSLLKGAGLAEQEAVQEALAPAAPVWARGKNGAFLAAFPSDAFRVSYTLSYDCPCIGDQFLDAVVDGAYFEKEIASARTFCLEEEALILIKQGLGKGANYENTLVMGKEGPVRTTLRYPDEPVRHKVLDLIGDLYLTGMPVRAHIVAIKSGHALNLELVRKLNQAQKGPVARAR